MKTLVILLLVLTCVCCGTSDDSYFNPDETIRGVSFDWNNQADRDPTLVLQVAEAHLHGDTQGAWVKFVDDPKVDCRTPRKIAGCWLPDIDIIILKPYPKISSTALLHELTHRAQYRATGYLDMEHKEAPWWPLPSLSSPDNGE